MNRMKAFSISVCLGLMAVTLSPNAKADQWNKKTILTVNEPVSVPGKILQPGKYVMKLMDSQSNRHIVQVFDENEQQLQTTILAIPNQRLQPTGETQFGFWEMPAGQPKALRSWFYPGDNFGQEFAYPKDMAAQIAKATNENVPAIMSGEDNLASADVKEMSPQGESAEDDQQTAVAQTPPADTSAQTPSTDTTTAEPSETAQAQPSAPSTDSATVAAQPGTATSETGAGSAALPSTASPFPLVGLGGLFALGAAMVVRAVSRKK